MYGCGADTVAVAEGGRVSLFEMNGTHLTTVSLATLGRAVEMQGVTTDCRNLFLVEATAPSVPAEGELGALVGTGWWYDRDSGTVSEPVEFERSQVLGKRTTYQSTVILPWGRDASWATSDRAVFLGDGSAPIVEAFDVRGNLRHRITWDAEPVRVSPGNRARYERIRARRIARSPTWEELLPDLRGAPIPDVRPIFVSLLVAADGALWVQEYPDWAGGLWGLIRTGEVGDPPSRWLVFDEIGRLIAKVHIPAESRLLSASGDAVAVLERDSLDVEYVRVYPLDRSMGSRLTH